MTGTPKAADDNEGYPSLFVWREPTEAERDFSEWIMASYAQGLGATRAPDDDTDLERRRNRPPFTFVRLIRVLWGVGYRNALEREAKAELKRLEKLEQEQKARDEKRRLEELADTPITGLT